MFLGPGWLLARLLRSPLPLLLAALASSALAFNTVLALDAFRIPVTPGALACVFLAAMAVLALVMHRRAVGIGLQDWGPPSFRAETALWLVPPALALVSIAVRTVVEPLSGYDNAFRWDYLSRLLLERHSIAAYPPVTAGDFHLYSWCDGIPPLASVLNFIIYGAAGAYVPQLVALRAVAEFGLLALVVYRFSRELWGPGAGWPAVAILSGSALLMWGLAIEQETGLTALALTGMLYFVGSRPAGSESRRAYPVAAGLAAGVGAISREYGLYFVLLGAVLLLVGRRLREAPSFLAAAFFTAGPWYIRNWVKTGNPVFPALPGIFPSNAVYQEIMGDIRSFWSFAQAPVAAAVIPEVTMATAGLIVVAGLAGAFKAGRRGVPVVSGIAMIAGLCLWSMPLTAGGWVYAMRVLLPCVALGSVLSGWIARSGRRSRTVWALLACLVAADGARRSWMLPDFPFVAVWPLSFEKWRVAHDEAERSSKGKIWEVLVNAAAGGGILVDSPYPHVAVTRLGGQAVPFASPQFAPAFDPALDPDRALESLRARGVRFVTFSIHNPVVMRLIRRHPTLRALADEFQPVANLGGLLVFDLQFLERKKSAPETGTGSKPP